MSQDKPVLSREQIVGLKEALLGHHIPPCSQEQWRYVCDRAISDIDREVQRSTDFEKWYYEWLSQRQASRYPSPINAARAAWSAALERQGSGRWVPLEPTKEMLDAAKPAFATIDAWCAEMQLARGRKADWPDDDPPLKQAWRAMLAAAPQINEPPQVSSREQMPDAGQRPASGSPDISALVRNMQVEADECDKEGAHYTARLLRAAVDDLHALEVERDELKHDIARHLAICSEKDRDLDQMRELLREALDGWEEYADYDDFNKRKERIAEIRKKAL